MTVKIRNLRPEPLLSPPEARLSPWLEVGLDRIKEVRAAVKADAANVKWLFVAQNILAMKELGFGVSDLVAEHEENMKRWLTESGENKLWGEFPPLAACMTKLGLDVRKEVAAYAKPLQEDYGKQKERGDWPFLFLDMAIMRAIGFDVQQDLDENTPRIREGGFVPGADNKYSFYAHYLAAARECGIPVEDKIPRYAKEIKEDLESSAQKNMWGPFIMMAADMAKLGLLTPNQDYNKKPEPGTPPLKRFT